MSLDSTKCVPLSAEMLIWCMFPTIYSEGLIVLSGCPSAELFKKIVSGDEKSIMNTINWYKDVFGDDYYLEIMRHENVDNQEKVNQWICLLYTSPSPRD